MQLTIISLACYRSLGACGGDDCSSLACKGKRGIELKTKDMTMIALMTALICVAGPLSISIGPIPITLSNFAVYLAAAVLGAKGGPIAVALYLLIGAAGVPVFSGFTGGLQKLIGVTGGSYQSGSGSPPRDSISFE